MKRGISTVVASILLILLAVVAVVIIWFLLKGFITKSAGGIETSCITLDLEIEKAEINADSNILYVQVKRGSGEGNLSGIRFKITNSSESMIRDRNTSMNELETKSFSFNDTGNVSVISKVEIAGVISFNNQEKICRIISSKNIFDVYSSPPAQVCGNNITEGDEECDGTNLGGQTCQSKGYYFGSLTCLNCVIDDSGCSGRCSDSVCDEGYENYTSCSADCPATFVDPDGDISTLGWISTPSGIHYTTIDDKTRYNNVPDTADNIENDVAAATDIFSMTNLTATQVTQIKVWVYCAVDYGSIWVDISKDVGTTVTWLGEVQVKYMNNPYGWVNATYSGLSWTQADLNNLRVKLRSISNTDPDVGGYTRVASMYAEVTYT